MIVVATKTESSIAESNKVPCADPSYLHVGQKYYVVAIGASSGGVWYYLNAIRDVPYPYPFASDLFDIVDHALPHDARVHMSYTNVEWLVIAPAFWAEAPAFYERLLDAIPGKPSPEQDAFLAYTQALRQQLDEDIIV